MNKSLKLGLIVSILVLTVALFSTIKAQTPEENMKTFFDSELPGLRIQVNATAETQPTQYIIVSLKIEALTEVTVKHLNLSIIGFIQGKDKVSIGNIGNGTSLPPLHSASNTFNTTCRVPENVWDTVYGDIALTYSAKSEFGGMNVTIDYPPFSAGFTMTYVENIYLKNIQESLQNLNSTFWQCFGKNLTQEDLMAINRTYWALQGSQGELDNSRRVVAGLAVTTVFFVATTVFMFLRKPKQTW